MAALPIAVRAAQSSAHFAGLGAAIKHLEQMFHPSYLFWVVAGLVAFLALGTLGALLYFVFKRRKTPKRARSRDILPTTLGSSVPRPLVLPNVLIGQLPHAMGKAVKEKVHNVQDEWLNKYEEWDEKRVTKVHLLFHC